MNILAARKPEQVQKMKELQRDRVCFFCKKNFMKYQDTPILREKKWWLIRKNDFPYDGARIHLLIIYKKHVDTIKKVSNAAILELFDHIRWVNKRFKISGASFVLRFGDPKYTGATITHLHAHLVSGQRQKKNSKVMISAIGYK